MIKHSANPVFAKALCQALLAALSARPAGALLTAPNVHLYVNNVVPTTRTALTDLTEATFAGYATIALPALAGPVHLANDSEALIAEVNFIAGSVVAPGQDAWGYYVTDSTNAVLYWAEKFDAMVPFASAEDFLSIVLQVPEPGIRPTE